MQVSWYMWCLIVETFELFGWHNVTLCSESQSALRFTHHHWRPEGTNVAQKKVIESDMVSKQLLLCLNIMELLQNDFIHTRIMLWTQTRPQVFQPFWDFHNWYCAEIMIISGVVNERKYQAPFLLTLLANVNRGWHRTVNTTGSGWLYEHKHYVIKFFNLFRASTTVIVQQTWLYRP